MKIITENELVRIVDNEQDYDFIGYIVNKSNHDIAIIFNDNEYEDYPTIINANNWMGFLADDAGYNAFEMIKNGKYIIMEEI